MLQPKCYSNVEKQLFVVLHSCRQDWVDATELEAPSEDSPDYEEEMKRKAAAEASPRFPAHMPSVNIVAKYPH